MLFTAERAFSEERCRALEALFDMDVGWARHEDPMYRCVNADVTERLDATWLSALARRMAELTGLDLVEQARTTVQRMEPGDHVGPHADRPLLGYEAARLVLQLDSQLDAKDGGLFRAFDGGELILERKPQRGSAIGLALSNRSLHEVTRTRRTRRSVVFNFWHRGNTGPVVRLVRGLFDPMSFGALPEAVTRVADAAEREWSETDTHRAGTVAYALTAWGYDPEEAAAGYRRALNEPVELAPELHVATCVALWLARLHIEDFDHEAWSALRDELMPLGPERCDRLRVPWGLAFDG